MRTSDRPPTRPPRRPRDPLADVPAFLLAYERLMYANLVRQGLVRPYHRLLGLMHRHRAARHRAHPLHPQEAALLDEVERSYLRLIVDRVTRHDAEDVIQSALLKLFERQAEIPPERWPGWLKTAVRKTDQERRKAWARANRLTPPVEEDDEDSEPASSLPTPEVELGKRELDAELRRLCCHLRPEVQQVVLLYHCDERRMDDVAAELQIHPETGWKRWRIALSHLRKIVDREAARERNNSGGFSGYEVGVVLLLWEWGRGWMRRVAGGRAGERRYRGSRWPVLAAAVPLVVLPCIPALRRAFSPAALAPMDDVTMSEAASYPSVGLFLPAWAEREQESGEGEPAMSRALPARSTPGSALADGATGSGGDAAPQRTAALSPSERQRARIYLAQATAALHGDQPELARRALRLYERLFPENPWPAQYAALKAQTTP